MIESLKGELETTYEEIVDVLSRRLEKVWDTLKEMQRESNTLNDKVEAVRSALADLKQESLLYSLADGERARLEAHLRKLEDLLR
jgi:predicted  nucleic acid-binding Zn-ribbon protein